METERVINLYDSEKNNDLCRYIEFPQFCSFAKKILRFRIDYITDEVCCLLTVVYKEYEFQCRYNDLSLLFQDIEKLDFFYKRMEGTIMKAEKKEKTIVYVIAVILGFITGSIINLIGILVDKVLGHSAGVAYFILVLVGGFILFAICINKCLNEEEEEEENPNYDETIKSMLKELKSKGIIGEEND